MDDIVKAALAKWPNVPHCHGWLALDARGQWYMRDERTQAAGPFPRVKGSRIGHDKLLGFIHRNYGRDDAGAWFFQNGPQRVYVQLEAAPYVWRVRRHDGGFEVSAHTGPQTQPLGAWLDESAPPPPSVRARALDHISGHPGQAAHPVVVGLGHVDTREPAQLLDHPQEVEGVEVGGRAQVGSRVELHRVDVRRHLDDSRARRGEGLDQVHAPTPASSSSSTPATSALARRPSDTRWSAATVTVTTGRATTCPSTAHGRRTTRPRPTSAT